MMHQPEQRPGEAEQRHDAAEEQRLAADAIGQGAGERDHQQQAEHAHAVEVERLGGGDQIDLPQIGRDIDEADVEADSLDDVEAEDPDDPPPFGRECLDHRQVKRTIGARDGVVRQAAAEIEADRAQHDAEEERDAPPPRVGRRGAERGDDERADRRAEQDAGDRPEHVPAAEKAAPPGGGVLDQEDARGRAFAADGEALDEAQHDEQRRGRHADLGMGRQHADEESRHRHRGDRDGQRRLAADAVADMAEDEAAEGTHEKAGGKDAEGSEQR